jgi:radical SAM superfamily enzyme YgiQ (UPF0313 family)
MKVALLTTAMKKDKKLKNFSRRKLPKVAHYGKLASLLLPPIVQRLLLSSFTLERRLPTGLGLLSSMLKQNGHEVLLIDRFVDEDDWMENIEDIDFVGVHTTTPCFDDALYIVEKLVREGYTGRIAFGGPHASLYPDTAPERVDYVVRGEGEYVINDLVEGHFPSGSIIESPRINDLDDLPMVDYPLFFQKKRGYDLSAPFFDEEPVFNLSTSRSCPYSCTFCATRRIWGLLWKTPSPEKIVKEIVYLKETYYIGGIYFREDLFTSNKKRVMEICRLMREHEVNLPWACETRAQEACDAEMVAEMAKSGCRGFYIGAESGSQRMLDLYNKEATVFQTIEACSIAKRNGIKVAMSIIVADPASNFRDRFETWKMVRKCAPEILYCSVYDGDHTANRKISNYQSHSSRTMIKADYLNGTWKGQRDRIGLVNVSDLY